MLASRRVRLGREKSAPEVVELIRDCILEGLLRPGDCMSTHDVCRALIVPHDTLSEAYVELSHQRLVGYAPSVGAYVRVPTRRDVIELYGCRRVVEIAAVSTVRTREDLAEVREAVKRGERCADRQDWVGVGTADVAFHRAVTALNGSSRVDKFMNGSWNELRLVFHLMRRPAEFHGPYLERNRAILDVLLDQRIDVGVRLMREYLDAAEQDILSAHPEPP